MIGMLGYNCYSTLLGIPINNATTYFMLQVVSYGLQLSYYNTTIGMTCMLKDRSFANT